MNAQRSKRKNSAEAIQCLVVHEADGQTGIQNRKEGSFPLMNTAGT